MKGNNNKKRVALLFFGQPRYTGNRLITYLLKKKIFEQYNTEVFASIWYDSNASFEQSNWTLNEKVKKVSLVRKSAIKDLSSRYRCENLKLFYLKNLLFLTLFLLRSMRLQIYIKTYQIYLANFIYFKRLVDTY